MTDSASKTPETAAATETATAAASSQMTDTPQPSEPDTPSPTSIAPVSAVTAAPAEPRELVLIEYKESTLHSLEEFAKLQNSARAQKDDLDAMVLNIAKTGQVWFVFFFSFSLFVCPFFFHIHMCVLIAIHGIWSSSISHSDSRLFAMKPFFKFCCFPFSFI